MQAVLTEIKLFICRGFLSLSLITNVLVTAKIFGSYNIDSTHTGLNTSKSGKRNTCTHMRENHLHRKNSS